MRLIAIAIGACVGLFIGVGLHSSLLEIAVFLFAGAYAGEMLFRVKTSSGQPRRLDPSSMLDNDAQGLSDATDTSHVNRLINLVAHLEARVAALERALSKNAPHWVDVKEQTVETHMPLANEEPDTSSIIDAVDVTTSVPTPVAASRAASVSASAKASVPTKPLVDLSHTLFETQQPAQVIPVPIQESTPSIPLRDRLPQPIKELIFGGNTLVKLGTLILFFGLAFLLRYTAERVTVPIEMRYTFVALMGTGLLALGWRLRHRRPDYGIVLQGAGIGIFYLTTLAAMKIHGLLPINAAFAFLFGVSVLGAVLAVLQNASTLAIIAVLEGFAAPVLASTGENHPVGLFTYLLILDVGIFLVAWFKAWRVLNLIGALGTFTLALGWAEKYYTIEQFGIVQPFLIIFFLLFVAISFLFARRTLLDAPVDESASLGTRAVNTLRQVGRVDSTLAFGVPMAVFGLEYCLVKPWSMGPAFAAMGFAAFYLLLSKWVWSGRARGLALLAEAYAIVGLIFTTLAIPLALEGEWTAAAWAVEAAGMYWLGARQQRLYARAFAFVVLAGAVVNLLQVTQLDGVPGHALFEGSWIGPLLVAAGAFAMWAIERRSKLDVGMSREVFAGACLPWLGMSSLILLLWQCFVPSWAAVATAVLASISFVLAIRFNLMPLVHVTYGMQTLAVVSFISTLHRAGDDGGGLAGGWHGMVAALVIAASVLSSVAWSMRRALQSDTSVNIAKSWSIGNMIAVVTGVTLLHLSMLFQISLSQAALLWPISASVVLWVALRIGHPALVLQAAALHGISAVLYVTHSSGAGDFGTFSSLEFWTKISIGLTALWCGDQLRGTSKTRNPWSNLAWVLWLPVVWGLLWSLYAILSEASGTLQRMNLHTWIATVQMAIVLGSSALAVFIAAKRSWSQLACATVATLPGLFLITLASWGGWNRSSSLPFEYVPSDGIGWLVWPLAVLWHLRLLIWQEKWLSRSKLTMLHIAGFWFFVIVSARECQWLLGSLGDSWSSWSLLGWVLAPAIGLWMLQLPALLARWPLNAFRQPYVVTAASPIALYLLCWLWISNFASPGNADPLPFVPLLNPLELAHWLILCSLFAWVGRINPEVNNALISTFNKYALSLTGLALLTGMVLRSCHHFADVAWSIDSLFASRLTQAAVSITWALCGGALMVIGHTKSHRALWIAGATLMGMVVVKLFFVELADQGGLFRIVSFVGVGLLLLVVGYFAPVPPANKVVVRDSTGGTL